MTGRLDEGRRRAFDLIAVILSGQPDPIHREFRRLEHTSPEAAAWLVFVLGHVAAASTRQYALATGQDELDVLTSFADESQAAIEGLE